MKKSLLSFLVALFIFSSVMAQPTLTAGNTTPQIGESFISQYAKSVNVNAYSGGANQTWDYSGLQDSAAGYRFLAVLPASTPYADSFPTSNLVLKAYNDSVYLYFNSQSNFLRELGAAATDTLGVLRYQPTKIYLPYPFTYNTAFTDSVAYITSVGGNNFKLKGRDSLLGEGYGTLKIPGRTFGNTLRVRYIENVSFDSTIDGTTIQVNIRNINYIYYTPDTHAPLLSYSYSITKTTTSLGPIVITNSDTSTDVTYLKNFILPVTFASFNASLVNNSVDLKWQTGQEINSDKFNVQRSLTATGFTDIAELSATGKSTGSIYNYTDEDFAKSGVPPTVYYRIKETDKDGKVFYSTTNIVHGNTVNASVYPNPAKDYINIKIKDVTTADAISISDAKGHLIQQFKNYQISKPVNISSLSKGTYFIQIKIKDNTTTTTIIKQ